MKKLISLITLISILVITISSSVYAESIWADGSEDGIGTWVADPVPTPIPTPTPTPEPTPEPGVTPTPKPLPTPLKYTDFDKRITTMLDKYKKITPKTALDNLKKFVDVKSHWAKTSMVKLNTLNIISANKDKTLKPESNINVNTFLTITLRTLGFSPKVDKKQPDKAYIDLAIKEKLISSRDFKKYNVPITKEQASKIAVNAVLRTAGATGSDPRAYNLMRSKIKDFSKIGSSYRQSIIDGYWYGLLFFDKSMNFNPKSYLKRGEASAMAVRLIDKKERKPWYPKESEVLVMTNRSNKNSSEYVGWQTYIGKFVKESEKKDYPPYTRFVPGYLMNYGNAVFDINCPMDNMPIYSDGHPELMKVMKYLYNNKKLMKTNYSFSYTNEALYKKFPFLAYNIDSFITIMSETKEEADFANSYFSFQVYNKTNVNGENYNKPYVMRIHSRNHPNEHPLYETEKYAKQYFEGLMKILFPIKRDYDAFMKLLRNAKSIEDSRDGLKIGNRELSMGVRDFFEIRLGLPGVKGITPEEATIENNKAYKITLKHNPLADYLEIPFKRIDYTR